MIPKLYSFDETAAHLRISRRTLTKYILDGKIRSTKQGKYRFFTEEHILEFIRNVEA